MTRAGGTVTVLGLIAALAIGVLGPASGAAAQDLVDVGAGGSVTLPATEDAVVIFPISVVTAAQIADLRVEVVRVVRDGMPVESAAARAVEVSLDPAGPSLVVEADVDALGRIGEYTVTVAVTAGTQRQLIDLTLRRAPATVTAPTTVEVARTVFFPELGLPCLFRCTPTPTTLRLVAGPDTRITTLSVFDTDAGPATVLVEPFDGATPASVIPPLTYGGSLALAYHIEGDPPLGTVTRRLQVDSPQLERPVTVDFRITTKRHPALIVAIAAIGLFLGWLVRTMLVDVTRRAAAVRRAADLMARLQRLRDAREDAPFGRKVADTIASLGGVSFRKPTSVAAAETLIDTAEREAQDALDDLATRLDAVNQRIAAFEQDLRSTTWQLPAELRRRFAAAVALLDRIDARLMVQDAEGAATVAAELDVAIEVCLAEAVSATQRSADAARVLTAELGKLPANGTFAPLIPDIARVAELPVPAADGDLRLALRAAHRTEVETAAVVRSLHAAAVVAINGVRPQDRVTAEADAAALRRALDGPDPLARAAVEIPKFARMIVDLGGALGRDPAVRVDEAGDVGAQDGPARAWTPAAREPVAVPRRPGLANTVVLVSETVRYLILGLVLSVLAYSWFGSDWTGTLSQAISIFTWAFAIDIGLDAVRAAIPSASATTSTA